MKLLIINPGATSTKIAVFEDEEQLFKVTIDHSAEELDRFPRVIDQADYRKEAILKAVTEAGYKLSDFAAVCGRGGLYRAIPSGTYAVNDKVMADVEAAPYGEHPSNLGAYLARKLGDMVGIPAFFVDPVCVDEMTEVAHYTGFAEFRRLCQFHALNHKAVGRKAAEKLGKKYEDVNLIVCHLGGGVSVGAHQHGRVVDVCNVKDEGAMGMDRAGGLPLIGLLRTVFLRADGDAVGDHERGVEAHAELADDVDIGILLVLFLGLLAELVGTRRRDDAEVVFKLFAAHADAVIRDRQRAVLLVDRHRDGKIAAVHADLVVRQRDVTELVDGVAGVGNDLAQEDLLVRVNRVDHQIEQTLRFCFKLFFSHKSIPL